MRATRRKPRIGGRLTALLVFFCLLVQQTAMPIHLLSEDHCRVIDPTASNNPGAACRHADEHHAHHVHHEPHEHGACGNARHSDPGANADPGASADPCAHATPSHHGPGSDCPAGHCPHPVSEHLTDWVAVAQRDNAQIVVSLDAVATAPAASEGAPDRVEVLAPRRVRPPPRDLSSSPASPRAPPRV